MYACSDNNPHASAKTYTVEFLTFEVAETETSECVTKNSTNITIDKNIPQNGLKAKEMTLVLLSESVISLIA